MCNTILIKNNRHKAKWLGNRLMLIVNNKIIKKIILTASIAKIENSVIESYGDIAKQLINNAINTPNKITFDQLIDFENLTQDYFFVSTHSERVDYLQRGVFNHDLIKKIIISRTQKEEK